MITPTFRLWYHFLGRHEDWGAHKPKNKTLKELDTSYICKILRHQVYRSHLLWSLNFIILNQCMTQTHTWILNIHAHYCVGWVTIVAFGVPFEAWGSVGSVENVWRRVGKAGVLLLAKAWAKITSWGGLVGFFKMLGSSDVLLVKLKGILTALEINCLGFGI